MKFPRLRTIVFGLAVMLLVLCFSAWLILRSDAFWRWAGHRLVALVNDQVQGELTVREIEGNPFTGYLFKDITLTSPHGQVLRAKTFEIRLSFLSLLTLKPVIGKLAFLQPHLTLQQDEAGTWNVTQLLPPREGPPAQVSLPVRSLSFSHILIQDGQVTMVQPGGTRQYQDLDLNLAFSVSQPLTPQQLLMVKQLAVSATTPWGRYALAGRLSYSQKKMEVPSLTLHSDDHRLLIVAGKAILAEKDGDVQLAGEIGPIPPAILSRFSAKWPPAWDLAGKFQLQGPLDRLQLNWKGNIYQAQYSLMGLFRQDRETWDYDVNIKLEDVRPEMLAALDAARAKEYHQATPLSARLHLKGSGIAWPPRQFSWNLQVSPLKYRSIQLEKLKVTLQGTEKQQSLDGLIQGNFGRLTLESRGSLLVAPKGEIKLRAENFQPVPLGVSLPEGSVFTGGFTGSFSSPDFKIPDRLAITGELQVSGRLGPHALRELRARLAWDKPNLKISQSRMHLGNVLAELQGSLKGDKLDFSLQGRSLPGGNWPVPAAVGGSLTWQGNLQGRLQEPLYTFQAQGKSLSWEKLSVRSFSLKARGQGLPPRQGEVDLKANALNTPAGAFSQVSVQGRGEADRWSFRVNGTSPAKGPQVELTGLADIGSRPFSLTLERLRLHLFEVSLHNRGPIEMRFLPGLDLEPATLIVNGGTVNAQARLQGVQIDGRLELVDLPVEIARIQGLQGKIQGQVTVAGTTGNPTIEGQVGLQPGRWRHFSFQFAKTTISYRDAVLGLSGKFQESSQGARLTWDGSLPLQVSLSPWQFNLPDEDFRLRLRSDGVNLAMLGAVTSEVKEAGGAVDLQADLQGRLRQPKVSGQIRWGEGYITLRQTGAPWRLHPGTIRMDTDRLSLPQLTLENRGTAILSGDLRLTDFQPERLAARLQVDNFKALGRSGSEGFLSGNVSLNGPWSALLLQGQLTIPQASISPDLIRPDADELPSDVVLGCDGHGRPPPKPGKPKEAPPPEPYRNMKIALTVEAPGNVWVVDKLGKAELAMNLDIHKKPGQSVQVGGSIRSLEGKFDVYGKEFTLEKGLVTLPGVPNQEPFIEARAVHEMTDATFIVDVSGPVNHPKIDLSSSPPMPPNDLLSYLIFNRPASSLSQGEFNVSQQAVGVLGGITARKIQELLGKDFPLLGDVSLKSGTGTVGVVKPLAKGLTVSVERKISPTERDDPAQVRLEYRINRYLSVQGEQGRTSTGGDVLFNYEFDF